MTTEPLVSIVTPSYNQASSLEQTICSVLEQDYSNIEYIIVDGGSTDGSVGIIRRYEEHLSHWVSEPDHGQAHAINKGFARASGEIMAWINSDDYYLPGAISCVVAALQADPKLSGVYGGVEMVDEQSSCLESRLPLPPSRAMLIWFDYIEQPAAFWRRYCWDLVGPLREDMHYAFDWDWFIRAFGAGKWGPIHNSLACYRLTGQNKTSTGGQQRRREIASVARRYGTILHPLFLHYQFTRLAIRINPSLEQAFAHASLTKSEKVLAFPRICMMWIWHLVKRWYKTRASGPGSIVKSSAPNRSSS